MGKKNVGQAIIILAAIFTIIGGIIAIIQFVKPPSSNSFTSNPINPNSATTFTTSQSNAATDPYVHQGILAVDDPLNDNSKGYNWVTPSDNSCGFPGHGYHVFAQPGNGVGCTTNSSTTNFTNFVYQATITVQHGDGKTIEAIIFRYDGVHQSFYYFGFDGFGNYTVGIKQNNIYLSPPLKQGHSSDFQEGLGVSNLLAVVVRGNKIDFYVNSVSIDFAQDPNNTVSSGQIGVYAAGGSSGDPSSVSSEIVFSDVQVWKL